MDFEVSAELVGIYLEDAREHLAVLDDALLRLEQSGPDPDVVASLLGPLHTLKGNSGMIGFTGIKDYVHGLEDAFTRVRDGALTLEPAVLQPLFEGASALREAIEAAAAAGREGRDLGAERAVLASLLAAGDAAPSPAPAAPAETGRSGKGGDTTLAAARSSLVRVDFAKLDHLLNLVGELIVHRTKLTEMGRQVGTVVPEVGQELLDSVHQVASVSTQLQETIMDIRMLPIRHVFERFPRLVRDLAHGQDKQIELILQGEDTRVDKAVIDEMGEPLVHLIRNAVDHGIEPPAARAAAGKSPTGTILLSAAQESNQVVITLVDDGAGIDATEVRRRAVERGLLGADEKLSDREIIQFIFTEGFSTARSVTDVSGRGVGLDVVVQSMERLNGLIEAETIPGAGTKFILQLPLTLAIITVLMVEVGDNVYALPSGAVVESLHFRPDEVSQMNGRDTLRIRDRIIPLVHLAEFFGVASRPHSAETYAVIVGRGEKRLGLTVDRLLGQQDVVIKGLDSVVSGTALGVAGATILGDGRVVLVLDVAALFESSRGRGRRGATWAPAEA
ncbi:MAG: chemotaxis protein CheA [Acidobacteriota bacterium]|jgi:two-component system chemotaxis sensor kinase CheA